MSDRLDDQERHLIDCNLYYSLTVFPLLNLFPSINSNYSHSLIMLKLTLFGTLWLEGYG